MGDAKAAQDAKDATDAKDAKAAKNARMEEDTKRTVYVGGLPFNTTEPQLRKDFSECGPIKRVTMLLKDGKFAGAAFIVFHNESALPEALTFDGDEYGGRRLT